MQWLIQSIPSVRPAEFKTHGIVARVGECVGVNVLVVASTDGSRGIALLSGC